MASNSRTHPQESSSPNLVEWTATVLGEELRGPLRDLSSTMTVEDDDELRPSRLFGGHVERFYEYDVLHRDAFALVARVAHGQAERRTSGEGRPAGRAAGIVEYRRNK